MSDWNRKWLWWVDDWDKPPVEFTDHKDDGVWIAISSSFNHLTLTDNDVEALRDLCDAILRDRGVCDD